MKQYKEKKEKLKKEMNGGKLIMQVSFIHISAFLKLVREADFDHIEFLPI